MSEIIWCAEHANTCVEAKSPSQNHSFIASRSWHLAASIFVVVTFILTESLLAGNRYQTLLIETL
jgi:hypothetical protein